MRLVHTFAVKVEFGDCDPAQIVYFPNFFRWIDAASHNYFIACGVPNWIDIEAATGIIGTPLVDTQARFLQPASYGDRIEVDTEVTEWRNTSFVMQHRIRRGEDLLVECTEVRVFAKRLEGDRLRIRAVPVPVDIRARCAGGSGERVGAG